MYLNEEQLKALQQVELEMLVEIDRICRQNNICYTLDSGTLLGAVRNKGFIHWDDDADVVMTRDAYERFYQACKTQLDTKRFFLQDYRTDNEYRWGYPKMRRKDSLFVREDQAMLPWHQGIFIDIFVYDNVPDTWIARRLHLIFCYIIRKVQYAIVGKENAKSHLLRMWYGVLMKIPRDIVFVWMEKVYSRCNRYPTSLKRHMTYPYRKKCRYGLPSKCFNKQIELEFEGHNFLCSQEYDTYLTILYDDYMVPPPKEERNHTAIKTLKLPENGD